MERRRAKMSKKRETEDADLSNSEKYLRILLQIEIRKMFAKKDGSLKIAEAARFLNSLGCTPTQVANLLGKQKATEVSAYLYDKKRSGRGKKKQVGAPTQADSES